MSRAVNENSLVFGEFDVAIRSLNCSQITPVAIQSIFKKLDRDENQKVSITEIESLFKELTRKSNSSISPD